MIPKANFREFEKEFQRMTDDSIKKLAMARIVGTPAYVIKGLGLEFPPGQDILWGLLILGQKDLHFFVHASESAFAAMFRSATNGTPPREQYLRIRRESLRSLEALEPQPSLLSPKRLLPFLRGRPRLLKVQFHHQASGQDGGGHPQESCTLVLEPLAGLEEITPLLQEYFEAPGPGGG